MFSVQQVLTLLCERLIDGENINVYTFKSVKQLHRQAYGLFVDTYALTNFLVNYQFPGLLPEIQLSVISQYSSDKKFALEGKRKEQRGTALLCPRGWIQLRITLSQDS
ncbi:hypothetical protein DP117_11505 [Brasilonema sp. UFV-L1]|nr:hypothetical protein [Brasilonema sp. UFV-L1]